MQVKYISEIELCTFIPGQTRSANDSPSLSGGESFKSVLKTVTVRGSLTMTSIAVGFGF